jgi:hypothetical protein
MAGLPIPRMTAERSCRLPPEHTSRPVDHLVLPLAPLGFVPSLTEAMPGVPFEDVVLTAERD